MKELVSSDSFEKEADRFLGGYPSILGNDAEKALKGATVMDPKVKQWLFDWLEKNYDVKR